MLITKTKEKKLKRDLEIYQDYQRLLNSQKGNMKTAVEDVIMAKYDVSRVTIWQIRKRVEQRLKSKNESSI